MTADKIELLPLPASSYQLNHDDATGTEIAPPTPFWNAGKMQAYARACVAHAIAANDAEIEALRAEVEAAKGRAAENLQRAADAEAYAERLTEALRDATTMLLVDYPVTAKRLRAVITAAQESER